MKRNIWENLNGDRSFSCRLCSDINNGLGPRVSAWCAPEVLFPITWQKLGFKRLYLHHTPCHTHSHSLYRRQRREGLWFPNMLTWGSGQVPSTAWASTPPLSSLPPTGAARCRHHQVPPTQGMTLGLEKLQENSHHRSTGLRAAGTPWTVPGTEVQQSLQSLPG